MVGKRPGLVGVGVCARPCQALAQVWAVKKTPHLRVCLAGSSISLSRLGLAPRFKLLLGSSARSGTDVVIVEKGRDRERHPLFRQGVRFDGQ